MMIGSPRDVFKSKIRFYEKAARKVRKTAHRKWFSGSCSFEIYKVDLDIADQYDKKVLQYTEALMKYDEAKGL